MIAISLLGGTSALNAVYVVKFRPVNKDEEIQFLLLPTNTSYLFHKEDLIKYRTITFSFANATDSERNQIEITLESGLTKKEKRTWYNFTGETNLKESEKKEKCSALSRYWPHSQSDLNVTGTLHVHVTCDSSGHEEGVSIEWKWSKIHKDHGGNDGDDGYAFECGSNSAQKHTCKCNKSTLIDATKVLENRNNKDVVTFRFCTEEEETTEIHVQYTTHFYEYQYVPEDQYDLYIMSTRAGNITIPLDKEEYNLYLTVNSIAKTSNSVEVEITKTKHVEHTAEDFKNQQTIVYYGAIATVLSSLTTAILVFVSQCIAYCNK